MVQAEEMKRNLYINFLVFLCLLSQCYGAKSSRPRPATHRPATSRPATFRPFPTHAPTFRPFPTHAPTFRPFPTHAPTFRPVPTRAPTMRPFPTHSPTARPFPTHSPTMRPMPTRAPTARPFPTHAPTFRPQGPYPTRPGYQTPPPIFRPSGLGGQINQPIYQRPLAIPAPGGKTKIKVYNVNNYHHPGYYAPPSYPVYRYGSSDVGSGALGFFLGYSLAKVTQPTYYRYHGGASYDGYTPRFDHYTIHHYHNNPQAIPPRQTLSANTIETCGDSAQICPAGTSALCTAKGEIMCVVNALSTVACKDDANRRCVKTTIPCENDQAPECKGIPKGSTTSIDIPCISNAELSGNVTTVNNTIVSLEKKNSTLVTTTQLPITTLPTSNTVPSLGYLRAKRQAPVQNYCVTIVAEPAVREPTEGEKVFNEVSSVFENLFSKAFNTR